MAAARPIRRLAALAMAPLAVSCATPDNAERRVRYSCDDGTMLAVAFAGDTARLYGNGEAPIELARQPAASGFLYGTGPHSIRGEGRAMTYFVGRRAPIECTAVGSSS